MSKAQFRTRHLEWFHNANSAESLIAGSNPQKYTSYSLTWLHFALNNLLSLATELRDEKLTDLVERLRGHYERRREESRDLNPIVIYYRLSYQIRDQHTLIKCWKYIGPPTTGDPYETCHQCGCAREKEPDVSPGLTSI